jgi:Fe-S cluster assembly protein SufD
VSLINEIKNYADNKKLSTDKRNALDNFLENGFPTIKDEEWRYTSLKKTISDKYSINAVGRDVTKKEIENHSLGLKHKIIFVDGFLISKPEIKNISISACSEFNTNAAEALGKLNYSLAKNGYTISVNANTIIKEPIEILFFNTVENNFIQYRNIISVGTNSQVKFIEKIQNIDSDNVFVNNFTHIKCESNSKLEFNKIQNNTPNSSLIDTVNVLQKKDSVSNINTLIFGGKLIRNNLDFEQNGTNAESNMNGISVLNKNQVADNHTFVDHKSPNCRSNEMYKGVYLEQSKGVFNGKIMVREDSQKIDAFQSNNTLLLSEDATINSKPQLEIYADDVKCSHGCTIGQLDKDALFYMRSRGIGEQEAQAILTYAFASEAINNITIKNVKMLAKKLLINKLDVDLDHNI